MRVLRDSARYWKQRAALLESTSKNSIAERVAAIVEKAKEKRRMSADEIRTGESAMARARVQGELSNSSRLKKNANKRARVAEAALAKALTLSEKRLRRAESAELELSASKATIDDYHGQHKSMVAAQEQYTTFLDKAASMPTWRPVRGKGSGRGRAKMEWGTRVIIYSLLAMMVPASAVGAVIVAIVKRTAPWLNPAAPTAATARPPELVSKSSFIRADSLKTAQVREMRFELRLLEEALAGRRVAAAYCVRQLGFDETTKFQDPSMVTSVLIEPTEGATPEVVVLRAAYATGDLPYVCLAIAATLATYTHELNHPTTTLQSGGGKSEMLVKAIEDKCFARLREFQIGWERTCKLMHPNHMWTGPDAARCGLQRLGNGGAIQSDTCTPARCTKRLLVTEVARQVTEKHSGWAQLSEVEQEKAVRVVRCG